MIKPVTIQGVTTSQFSLESNCSICFFKSPEINTTSAFMLVNSGLQEQQEKLLEQSYVKVYTLKQSQLLFQQNLEPECNNCFIFLFIAFLCVLTIYFQTYYTLCNSSQVPIKPIATWKIHEGKKKRLEEKINQAFPVIILGSVYQIQVNEILKFTLARVPFRLVGHSIANHLRSVVQIYQYLADMTVHIMIPVRILPTVFITDA